MVEIISFPPRYKVMYSKKSFTKRAAGFSFKKLRSDIKAAKDGKDIERIRSAAEYVLANTQRDAADWALDEYKDLMSDVGKKVNELRRTSRGFDVSGHVGPVGGGFGRDDTTEPLL